MVSPSDVQAERNALRPVIDNVKQMLRDGNYQTDFDLLRWETDAYPGMHAEGPQGIIDEQLRIGDSDVVIGVFWKRFGTPVGDAGSGTEHEIRRAIEAWKAKGAPNVMVYFCKAQFQAASPEEEEQLRKVHEFKRDLMSRDKALIWEYEDVSDFRELLLMHLWKIAMQRLQPARRAAWPFSFFRVSASAHPVVAREEGLTELMGDVFLHCTYQGDLPVHAAFSVDVGLSVFPTLAASGLRNRRDCDVVLLEVGRPGAASNVVPGRPADPGMNQINFRINLGGITAGETRVFQVTNLRCQCSGPIGLVYATMTGVPIENAQQKVATIRKGLNFEVRNADNSSRLAQHGYEISASSGLAVTRICTLRFTEGFPGAFKSRVPIAGRTWYTNSEGAVSTGESAPVCAVLADGSEVRVAGLADYGTRLEAVFTQLPDGIKVFVSERELYTAHACFASSRLISSPSELMVIAGIEVRQLPINNGGGVAIWETMTPLGGHLAGSLDFAVFASYNADPAKPSFGTSQVAGSFSPVVSAYCDGMPAPLFRDSSRTRCDILTVTP